MVGFVVRIVLVAIVPATFGYGLHYFLSHVRLPELASIGIAVVLGLLIAQQGNRNAKKFIQDHRTGESELTALSFVLRFSLPFFSAVACAFAADWIDWHYGLFIPSVSGLAAGAIAFLIAYFAVAIVYGPLRTIHIAGQRILDYKTAKLRALELGYQEGFEFGGIRIPDRRISTHFLVVGATGSGKTLTVYKLLADIANFLRRNPGARTVIYDPKQNILPVLDKLAPGVPVIDMHPYREGSLAWDLARDVRTSRDIETVANILFPEDRNNSENRFFVDAPREILQAVLRSFIELGVNDWSLRDLYCVLTSTQHLKALLQRSDHEKDVYAEYFNGDERTLSNVRLSLRTGLLKYRPIAAASHSRTSSGQSLSLSDWSKSNSGFLVLGSDKTPDSGIDALNRAALAMLSRYWLEGPNSGQHPKHFLILDEVQSAGKLSSLPALLTEGREKGVSVTLSFQDVASIRHIYGNDQSDALLNQFGNKAFLRLEGDSSAQWASKTVGETEQYEYTYSISRGRSATTTQNEQRVRKAALMPADFLTLPTTSETTGLTGFYQSAEIGVWKHKYQAGEIFDKKMPSDTAPKILQDDNLELQSLNSDDEARLGILAGEISKDETQLKRAKKLGDVNKIELDQD